MDGKNSYNVPIGAFLGGWCSFFYEFLAFVCDMDFFGSAIFFDHDKSFVFKGVKSFRGSSVDNCEGSRDVFDGN